MDVTQIVTSVGTVIDALKKAREVTKRLQDANMQAVLLDAQDAALTLKEELLNLRAENLELRERLETRDALTFDGGGYWREGDPRDGPFCPRCYDADKKAIRLTPTYGHHHRCPDCDKTFEVLSAPRRPDPPPLRVTRG